MNIVNYVKNAENIDLSDTDITKITDDKATIMSYTDLYNIDDIDDAFNNKQNLVLLYEISKGVGHWVALLKRQNNAIEFFDSYALDVDEELNYTQNYYKNGEAHLTRLLKNSKYHYYVNKTKFQEVKEHSNTCGRHCALRIKFSNLDLNAYTKLIYKPDNNYNSDFWVSCLTLFY